MNMEKLPLCPVCEQDELWLSTWDEFAELACAYCMWESGPFPVTPDVPLEQRIAAIVDGVRMRLKGSY